MPGIEWITTSFGLQYIFYESVFDKYFGVAGSSADGLAFHSCGL